MEETNEVIETVSFNGDGKETIIAAGVGLVSGIVGTILVNKVVIPTARKVKEKFKKEETIIEAKVVEHNKD